jgi:hypothetical protein
MMLSITIFMCPLPVNRDLMKISAFQGRLSSGVQAILKAGLEAGYCIEQVAKDCARVLLMPPWNDPITSTRADLGNCQVRREPR